jgi:peptidoglycan/xylan/chitin deacetylase (PgdA/CDA1 family)
MSVTRGEFLKSFGKALPGMVLGSGAVAAHKLFSKMAAVAGEPGEPIMTPLPRPNAEAKPAVFEIIECGPSTRPHIALTFDDGPNPGVTDRILDELQKRGAKATFFMIGERIAASPELARRVVAEGHDVANHTYTHPKLTEVPPARVEEELQKTQDIIHDVLGVQATWFRPPYLTFRRDLAPHVQRRGLRVVTGNVDPADWSQPGEEKIIEVITQKATPGSIVICHDMYAQTANAIGTILDRLLAAGLTPVTLSTLMAG